MEAMSVKEFTEKMLRHRIATEETLVGCTDEEIELLCKAQGVDKLPSIYIEWLKVMGKQAGWLMRGSDILYPIDYKEDFRETYYDEELDVSSSYEFPENSFVFWSHQGYQFRFFLVDATDSSAVYFWAEGMEKPEKDYDSFGQVLTAWTRYQKFHIYVPDWTPPNK